MGIIAEDDENAVMTIRECVEEMTRNATIASQDGRASDSVAFSQAALNAANALAILRAAFPGTTNLGATNNPHPKRVASST